MAAILKVWRQIENPTPSIDEHSYQISSQFYQKRRSFFKRQSPHQQQEQDE